MRKWIAIFCLLGLFACHDKQPAVGIYDNQLLLLNEGNFGWNNAEISIYNRDNDSLYNNLFAGINGQALGDVAMSAYRYDSLLYIVINNSHRIYELNAGSLKITRSFDGFDSPRYLIRYQDELIVTELYSNQIDLCDLNNGSLSHLPLNGSSEQIIQQGDTAYILCYTRPFGGAECHSLQRLYLPTNNLLPAIDLAKNPSSICRDNDHIWILCQGDSAASEPACIQGFRFSSQSIDRNIALGLTAQSLSHLCVDATAGKASYIQQSIRSIDLNHSGSLPMLSLPADGRLFYNLYWDEEHREYYVCDAADYVSQGSLYRYNDQWQLLSHHKAGRIPGAIIRNGL